jgi:hypothetical protein
MVPALGYFALLCAFTAIQLARRRLGPWAPKRRSGRPAPIETGWLAVKPGEWRWSAPRDAAPYLQPAMTVGLLAVALSISAPAQAQAATIVRQETAAQEAFTPFAPPDDTEVFWLSGVAGPSGPEAGWFV